MTIKHSVTAFLSTLALVVGVCAGVVALTGADARTVQPAAANCHRHHGTCPTSPPTTRPTSPSTTPTTPPTTRPTSPSTTPTTPPTTPTSPPTSPSSPTTSPATWSCVTSALYGRCGPYVYPLITGTRGGTSAGLPYVDMNIWGAISGETQTVSANSPGDWQVVNKTAAGNTAVTTYPNVGAPYDEQPLSAFSTIIGSFSETMPHSAGTSAWATYDNWFDDWGYEVMIQHDFVGNGPCDYVATATFGGSNGVPSQLWGLCTYGSELIWKLAAPGSTVGSNQTVNESSGKVDIKAMITWLVSHGYMRANPTITNLSYGWEICSTAGVPETFRVTGYSLLAQ